MSNWSPESDPTRYTPDWTNEEVGRPPGAAPAERVVELPEPDDGASQTTEPYMAAEPGQWKLPHCNVHDRFVQDCLGCASKVVAKGLIAPAPSLDMPGGKGSGWELPPKQTKAVQKWADVAMWQAPEHKDPQQPKVKVTMLYGDPLGLMAMINAQYTGRNITEPSLMTDAERREAWHAATVSKLSETPLEWIQMSINFENVSRAFTHQLVRTRMATYAQESQRFAVKDDIADAVKLPPSLAGTSSRDNFEAGCEAAGVNPNTNANQTQKWRNIWDGALEEIADAYGKLINSGMPAEDARGLLPTNMLTRIHMRVDMKTLLNLAGMRLCTQAQFEWRAVFAELARAFRNLVPERHPWRWQYELIAGSFRPVCYQVGHCPMKAKSDRHCSIRDQVETFAALGIPSSEWERPGAGPNDPQPIHPGQWLADPTAARVAPGQETK